MVLKRDSGKHTIVQESQIGNTLLFTKLNTHTTPLNEDKIKELNIKEKEECEKRTEEYQKCLQEAYLHGVEIIKDLLKQNPNVQIRRY